MSKITGHTTNDYVMRHSNLNFNTPEDEEEFVETVDDGFTDEFKKGLDNKSEFTDDEEVDEDENKEDNEEEDEEESEDTDDEEDEDESKSEDDEEDVEEDEEDVSDDEMAIQMERLMQIVNNLSSQLSSSETVDAGDIDENVQFVTEEEFEEIQNAESSESLNKVLGKVFKKAVETADARANTISDTKVSNKLSAAQVSEKFYNENADLQPVSNYVSQVARSLYQEEDNKGLSLAELLDKAGKETRKALGMNPSSKSKSSLDGDKGTRKRRNSKIPGSRGNKSRNRKKLKKQVEGIRSDIDELVANAKNRGTL